MVLNLKTRTKPFYASLSLSFIIQNEAVDVDMDEILDMDTDATRRSHLYVRHLPPLFSKSLC